METSSQYWARIQAEEAARREREKLTRTVKVRPQYRVGANDEAEPKPRLPLRARDLNSAQDES